MSVILQPQLAFPIVRQIANHTDSNTYYVRAVVRDADGNTLSTVNLEDQGGQRFQEKWQVVADPSGQGRYISIVTSVYTDSGYTTKSENYGDEENTYLVFDRVMPAMRGGGSSGIDARTVRRIVSEELEKAKPEPIEIPETEMPEMRWGEVLTMLSFMQDQIDTIPKERTDLAPVLTAVSQAVEAIKTKEVTPATDLGPVLTQLQALSTQLTELEKDEELSREHLKDVVMGMEDILGEKIETTVNEAIETTEFVTTQTTMPAKRNREREEQRPAFDIKKLAV